MWAKDRHHRIISLLASQEQLSLEGLAEEFSVSRETLRRDIMQLEAEGHLQRVHGGIVRAPDGSEPPFQSRVTANAEAKARIGAAAARLVRPGMLVMVDAGSTTLAFAACLAGIPGVSVVTNALDVATTVRAGKSAASVVLLGGVLGADVPGTFGETAIAQLRRFTPDLAILSPVALDARRGAMNYDLAEAELARAMTENAQRVVMLADHSKLGTTSRVQICGCDRIDILITDRKAAPARTAELTAAGVRELIRA